MEDKKSLYGKSTVRAQMLEEEHYLALQKQTMEDPRFNILRKAANEAIGLADRFKEVDKKTQNPTMTYAQAASHLFVFAMQVLRIIDPDNSDSREEKEGDEL